MFSKRDKIFAKYLGYICKKNCLQQLSKAAQSGHAVAGRKMHHLLLPTMHLMALTAPESIFSAKNY